MKYIVAVLFAFVVMAHAEEFKLRTAEDLFAARKECLVAQKIPVEHMEKYQKLDFPDDELTRCYIECLLEKLQLFNQTTGFIIDNLVAQLANGREDKDAIKAEVEKCAAKGEEQIDSCTWAYRGFKCFIANNLALVQEKVMQKN